MPTKPPSDLVDLIRSLKPRERRYAETGSVGVNGELGDPLAGISRPYMWVRFEGERAATRVLNSGKVDDQILGSPVVLEINRAGEWEIIGLDGARAPYVLGEGTAAAARARTSPEYNTQPMYARNIVDGRVRLSRMGGLYVAINGFDHAFGRFPPTEDVLLVPTATADAKAPIVLSVDVSTNAVYQTLGDDLAPEYSIQDDVESAKQKAGAVNTPDNHVRVGAVFLTDDATTVTVNDILDIRPLFGQFRTPLDLLIGGTGSDLSASGPGHLVQLANGAVLTVRKDNLAATAAPTTGDDSGDGYSIGSRWYDTTNQKEYVALDVSVGAAVWKETTASGSTGGGGTPQGYIVGGEVDFDGTNLTVQPFICRDDGDTYTLTKNTSTTINPASSGAAGLDTGSVAGNTWYYVWAIAKSSDNTTSAMISISSSSPTMPSGYDKKRRVGAIRRNGSSTFWRQYTQRGQGNLRRVEYKQDIRATTSNDFRILSSANIATATSWTNGNCAAVIPTTSRLGIFAIHAINAGAQHIVTWREGSHASELLDVFSSATGYTGITAELPVDSSQVFEVQNQSSVATENTTVLVFGYFDNIAPAIV